jgi:hypothetical protein
MKFSIRWPLVTDTQQQANNEDLLAAINFIAQHLSVGDGAPAHTPEGVQLYLRRDGGAGTTLYVYEPTPAAWNALA